jgi:transposase-like protein
MPLNDECAPVAGRDYPRNWNQFLQWFPDEAACAAYLEGLRWPKGFECPACHRLDDGWRVSRGRLMCRACGQQTTVTAGTVFQGTRTPLPSWFAAVWYVTGQKYGASALSLKRILGLGSYETAWTMLHKLRRAMVRPGRERLKGTVEVDETYVGGEEQGVRGRQTLRKAIVAIAVEVHAPKGFGRLRMQRIPDVSSVSLTGFVLGAVQPGTVVRTDGWKGYNDLAQAGYIRNRTVLAATGDPAHVAMPAVHRVASLLKRWLLGTHQGAVKPEHLDDYLDEFTFRFNRRTSRSRGLLFYRLLQNAVHVNPVPYSSIVAGGPAAHRFASEPRYH